MSDRILSELWPASRRIICVGARLRCSSNLLLKDPDLIGTQQEPPIESQVQLCSRSSAREALVVKQCLMLFVSVSTE